MESLNVKKMIPDIYCQESRDFQLLCNLYGCIVNGMKFDSTSTYKTIDSKTCKSEFLQLLGTKLGFFPDKKFNADQLREALIGFKDLINNKGSLTGVAGAVHVFLKTLGIHNKIRVSVTSNDTEFGGRTIKDHTVIVAIESAVTDTSLLTEIFKYIIPAGYEYIITFYTQIDPYDEFILKEEVTLIYTSDTINSTVGKKSASWTNLTEYQYYDGKYRKIQKTIWEVNDDYTVHALPNPEVTSSIDSHFVLMSNYQNYTLPAGAYYGYGCPKGGSGTTYMVTYKFYQPNGVSLNFYDYGNGVRINLGTETTVYIACSVKAGFEDYDLTFKPVLLDYIPEKLPSTFIPPSTLSTKTPNLITRLYHSYSLTSYGVTFTCNPDGSVVANGTNTWSREVSFAMCTSDQQYFLEPGTYRVSGCPAGGSAQSYSLYSTWWEGNTGKGYYDYGDGLINTIDSRKRIDFVARVGPGCTVNNVVFYPMIVADDAVYPYTPPETTVTQSSIADTLVSDIGSRLMGGVNDGEVVADTPHITDQYNLIPFCARFSTNPYTNSICTYEIMTDGSVTVKPLDAVVSGVYSYDYFYQSQTVNYLEFPPGIYRFSALCDNPEWPRTSGSDVTIYYHLGSPTATQRSWRTYNSTPSVQTMSSIWYLQEVALRSSQIDVAPQSNFKIMLERLSSTSDPIRPYQVPVLTTPLNFNYRGCVTNLNQITDPEGNDIVTLLTGNTYYMYLNGEYVQKQYGGTYMGLGLIPEPLDDIIVFASGSNLYYWRHNNDWIPLNFRIKASSLSESGITNPDNYDLIVANKEVLYAYKANLGLWVVLNPPIYLYEQQTHTT